MRVAIFDVDGTLVRSGSERAFGRYLVRAGKLGPRQLLAFAFGMLRLLPAAGIHVTKKNKCYLSGLRCSEVERLAAEFVTGWADAHWIEPAVQRLRSLQARGDTIVLLSGTPEFILRPIAERLGVSRYVGSVPERRDGKFIATLPTLHPFAEAKRTLAQRLLEEYGAAWEQVSAYGDSAYDLPLLERVGEAVAVGPDRALRHAARQRGWEIIEYSGSQRATAPR